MMKYACYLIVVEDVTVSRHFYEHLLGQKVEFDFVENIAFAGGFSIHRRAHFQSLLGDAVQYPVAKRPHNGELFFETDEIELIYQRLRAASGEFIHEVREQPWGQRVMRFYDPDGHIVEIGEPMDVVILRFHHQGLPLELVAEKSSMPLDDVKRIIREHAGPG